LWQLWTSGCCKLLFQNHSKLPREFKLFQIRSLVTCYHAIIMLLYFFLHHILHQLGQY
jgi:hypothetical protein